MRTIGLIGGMSWDSSATYYRAINTEVRRRLGGHHCAKLVLVSLDFGEVRALQIAGEWDRAGDLLAEAARALEAAGADAVLICANLMHKVAPTVEKATSLPLLHIADAVGSRARELGVRTVGILGARPVMEESFYAERLASGWGIDAVVPGPDDRATIDRVIFDELTRGVVSDASRAAYVDVIRRLEDAGAEAVVLACTEIGLLIGPDDVPIPVIDSALVHALAAVEEALRPPGHSVG
ncbi:MAG: amino-acid racemase [Actinomycetota bacterium]|nr:amino-acid racemase [Actinomycetota bacterium]